MEVNTDSYLFPTPSADIISSRSESLDQMDFLNMLVEQLKHQDPMDPLDDQAFASQLAQFSSLEELQGMSDLLENALSTNLLLAQSINNTMAATLIGKTVRAELNEISIGSVGDAALHYNLGTAATDITVEIYSSEGDLVRTLDVPAQTAGDQTVAWDGLDDNGIRAPEGNYTFTVTALDTEGNSVTATSFFEGQITGVQYENGSAVIMVGDIALDLSQILAILDPTRETANKGG